MKFLPYCLLCLLFTVQIAVAGDNNGKPTLQGKAFYHNTNEEPVSLVFFTAVYLDNKIRLSWNTENEINVKAYEVERSADGTSFTSVTIMSARNTQGENNYVHYDNSELSGTLHYRLKVINGNGSFFYSNVNTVNITKADNLKIVPNIVTDNIFAFHSRARAGAKIEVYSFDGRRVAQVSVLKDAVQTNINAGTMQPGRYHLVFADGDKVEFVRFIKQ